jgi:hypothetical protein
MQDEIHRPDYIVVGLIKTVSPVSFRHPRIMALR